MTRVILIIGRWVVPVQQDTPHTSPISTTSDSDLVIPYGAVAIRGCFILKVGKLEIIKKEFESEDPEIIDLSENHILIPGKTPIFFCSRLSWHFQQHQLWFLWLTAFFLRFYQSTSSHVLSLFPHNCVTTLILH